MARELAALIERLRFSGYADSIQAADALDALRREKIELRNELNEAWARVSALMSGADRYWEARWRDEAKKNAEAVEDNDALLRRVEQAERERDEARVLATDDR